MSFMEKLVVFTFYNTISLSHHEEVCLSGLRFERYFSHHWADMEKLVVFTFYNTISLSRHEEVCLSGLRFARYFSHHRPDDGRSISRNIAHLNILVHDVINLSYYEC